MDKKALLGTVSFAMGLAALIFTKTGHSDAAQSLVNCDAAMTSLSPEVVRACAEAAKESVEASKQLATTAVGMVMMGVGYLGGLFGQVKKK